MTRKEQLRDRFRIAYAAMMRAAEELRCALDDECEEAATRPDIAAIQRIVADHYGVTVRVLKLRGRDATHCLAREVAMTLAREFSAASLKAIGKAFHRDHGTVIYALRAVDARESTEKDFATELALLREQVKAALP